MSELKPCPFCGGEARIYMNDSDLDNIMWYCMCTNDRGCNVMPITLDHYSKEAAAAAWNTRHVETCSNKRGRCSACGSIMYDAPNYCAICGRKVEG